jgi:hypothetical protein
MQIVQRLLGSPRWRGATVLVAGPLLGFATERYRWDPRLLVAVLLALGVLLGVLWRTRLSARRLLAAVALPPAGLWLAATFC